MVYDYSFLDCALFLYFYQNYMAIWSLTSSFSNERISKGFEDPLNAYFLSCFHQQQTCHHSPQAYFARAQWAKIRQLVA